MKTNTWQQTWQLWQQKTICKINLFKTGNETYINLLHLFSTNCHHSEHKKSNKFDNRNICFVSVNKTQTSNSLNWFSLTKTNRFLDKILWKLVCDTFRIDSWFRTVRIHELSSQAFFSFWQLKNILLFNCNLVIDFSFYDSSIWSKDTLISRKLIRLLRMLLSFLDSYS